MLLAVTTWSYPAVCLRGTGLVAPWQRGWSWPHLTSGLLGALLFRLWFLAAVLCFQVLGSDGWRTRLDGTPESCVGTPGGRLLHEDGGFRSPTCAGAACGGHLGKGRAPRRKGPLLTLYVTHHVLGTLSSSPVCSYFLLGMSFSDLLTFKSCRKTHCLGFSLVGGTIPLELCWAVRATVRQGF